MKSSVINIVKTPQGYSIIQGDNLINKPHIINIKPSKQKTVSAPKKFTQQTFTIYPHIEQQRAHYSGQKYLIIPARAQWFNLNLVHEIEKKAMPEWFKIKKNTHIHATMIQNSNKFEKNEELYKKYRNHIIELGKSQYVTALKARKGLAGDVCSIIRIYDFLVKWGLINFVHASQKTSASESRISSEKENDLWLQEADQENSGGSSFSNCGGKLDCFERDKDHVKKDYNKDDLELLRKLTKKIRPTCTYCLGTCGITWYEYAEKVSFKRFEPKDPSDVSKGYRIDSGQSLDYHIRLCFSCYISKKMPMVLNYEDFQKHSILMNLKPPQEKVLRSRSNESAYNRIADGIEKSKLNVNKCAQTLKMSPSVVLNMLLEMPIKYLQAFSRIEPDTDSDEKESTTKSNSKKTTAGSALDEKLPETSDLHIPSSQGRKKEVGNEFIDGSEKIEALKEEKGDQIPDEERKIFTIEEENQTLTAEGVLDKDEEILKQKFKWIERDEKKAYEQYIQAWLSSIYVKLERLEEWDKSIFWSLSSTRSGQKQQLASLFERKFQALSEKSQVYDLNGRQEANSNAMEEPLLEEAIEAEKEEL